MPHARAHGRRHAASGRTVRECCILVQLHDKDYGAGRPPTLCLEIGKRWSLMLLRSSSSASKHSPSCAAAWSRCFLRGESSRACSPQTSVSNDLLGATASSNYWVIPRCFRLSLPFPQGRLSVSANHPLYEAPFPYNSHAHQAGTESPE